MSAHLSDAVENAIIEQRHEPRLPVVRPASLEGITGELRNISRSGAQIVCALDSAEALRAIVNNEKLQLEMLLEEAPIVLTVRVVYAQKREDGYAMGMRFLKSREDGRRDVIDFIDAM
ncbi:MAG: PilZ domain-containing protein [Gammaproteobacteria bacterium]|nr:PilZ domain-containing protein [Gammaproteobacteria bacterium]